MHPSTAIAEAARYELGLGFGFTAFIFLVCGISLGWFLRGERK